MEIIIRHETQWLVYNVNRQSAWLSEGVGLEFVVAYVIILSYCFFHSLFHRIEEQ